MNRPALFLSVLVLLVSAGAAQAPPLNPRPPKPPAAETDRCEKERSGLDVRIYAAEGRLNPAAELLLTDPEGRKVGMDPLTRKSYSEIPNGAYEFEGIDDDETGEPGPQTGIIELVCGPPAGEYKLEVIGTDDAPYDLDVLVYDDNWASASRHVGPLAIQRGQRHEYRIVWTKQPSAGVTVTRVKTPPRAKK